MVKENELEFDIRSADGMEIDGRLVSKILYLDCGSDRVTNAIKDVLDQASVKYELNEAKNVIQAFTFKDPAAQFNDQLNETLVKIVIRCGADKILVKAGGKNLTEAFVNASFILGVQYTLKILNQGK